MTIVNRPVAVPYWQTSDKETIKLYLGDVIEVLRKLPGGSVHMVVTSPPYYGLRDYGTAEWEGGSKECNHIAHERNSTLKSGLGYPSDGGPRRIGANNTYHNAHTQQYKDVCGKCGAKRVDSQIGGEPTPEEYITKMVSVFREVRRVLRNDGTVWLNLGDSYLSGAAGNSQDKPSGMSQTRPSRVGNLDKVNNTSRSNLAQGNLLGVPWRVALALQTDGWILRQDIIWHKSSTMPESTLNRCTKAHEYLFLLAPSKNYYYDNEAIKDDTKGNLNSTNWSTRASKGAKGGDKLVGMKNNHGDGLSHDLGGVGGTANKRSVWTIEDHRSLLDWLTLNDPELLQEYFSQSGNKRDVFKVAPAGYPGAHYATFNPKLIEPCILAGTSEYGCCANCGKPWVRVVSKGTGGAIGKSWYNHEGDGETGNFKTVSSEGYKPGSTLGWQQQCNCDTEDVVPCTVLEPFLGSGTTAEVCLTHERNCVGIDLSGDYLRENAIPRIIGILMSRPAFAHLIPPTANFSKPDSLGREIPRHVL